MRALIIGIGGAGCRIAEMMNQHDKSSKITSIRTFIFDSDRTILKNKSSIDQDHRIVLSPFDVSGELDSAKLKHGTDFDVSCIATVFQDAAVDEVDAIFVCAGLGGRMAETVPSIIKQLNEAFADPVFSILTLPARSEGARVSALASQELEDIRKVCSSSILFDNETWIQRLEELRAAESAREKEKDAKKNIVPRQSLSLPIKEVYDELNELLVRRIELLIRAGEITEKGIEVAEAVLDAGEVLNTLRDTDIVSIGYASAALPPTPHGIFKFFTPAEKDNPIDSGTERTSRIVELAKRAVYEEVSIPCDLTSADKALILITGPSEELSMKGFQTVRKWVDRSIKGLEMRAGDYPIHTVRNVAIVIVLAGIENVPRISELNSIRDSYQDEVRKIYPGEKDVATVIETNDESVEDKDIFEEEAECIIGNPQNALPPASSVDDDDFWLDSSPDSETTTDEDDDVFEDDVVVQPEPELPPVVPAFTTTPPSVRFPQEERVIPEPAPVQNYTLFEPDYIKEIKQDRKKDPQISLGGAKKVVKKNETEFFLPKREKKEDMVLHGQADIGGKDKPRDTEAVSRIGGPMRPREIEGVASIGSRQRPRDSDSGVSIGLRQRPKEIGGAVQISSLQKPKEIDSGVRISSAQKPREIDGAVHIASAQKPKEIGGTMHVSTGQRPKEIDGVVHIASAQKPKEIGGAVHISSAQKPKEIGNSVRIASAQKPKEFGDVRMVSAQKPREIGNNVRIASAQKPKEFRDARMASAQRPKEIGDNVRIASAQKPKEFGDVRMASAQKPKEIGDNVRIQPAEKKKEDNDIIKAGSKPTEDKIAEKRGMKWV